MGLSRDDAAAPLPRGAVVVFHRAAVKTIGWIVCVAALAACRESPSTRPSASATANTGAARAKKLSSGAIRVDGNLDEPAWRAAGTGPFVSPGDGSPAPNSRVQGEAWFAWDDQNLYFAARVADRSPVAPFAAAERDPHLWERSSAVELMLQPGDHGDNRHYYEIQADTACAKWTTRFDDYNRPQGTDAQGARTFGHQDWEPTIACAARVGADGYTIELALPWRDLDGAGRANAPPREGDVWRANVYSFRDGQRDALAWSPLRGEGNFHFAPRFGRVTFAGP